MLTTSGIRRGIVEQLIFPMTAAAALDADRVGPKCANLAAVGRAGLPIPDGFCVDSAAYRRQLKSLGLNLSIQRATSDAGLMAARRQAIEVRLALQSRPIIAEILEPLLASWQALVARSDGAASVVRSSSLVEDRFGSSSPRPFRSYLGGG